MLCSRSFGRHLYRLTEAMSVGAIPVLINDDFHLPFSEFLNWDEFSFRFAESEWRSVIPFLQLVPHEQVSKMKQKVIEVYDNYMKNETRIAQVVMEEIQAGVRRGRQIIQSERSG